MNENEMWNFNSAMMEVGEMNRKLSVELVCGYVWHGTLHSLYVLFMMCWVE